ncbi:hypothetical protein JZ751_022782, partial [Albula glossodonta]
MPAEPLVWAPLRSVSPGRIPLIRSTSECAAHCAGVRCVPGSCSDVGQLTNRFPIAALATMRQRVSPPLQGQQPSRNGDAPATAAARSPFITTHALAEEIGPQNPVQAEPSPFRGMGDGLMAESESPLCSNSLRSCQENEEVEKEEEVE